MNASLNLANERRSPVAPLTAVLEISRITLRQLMGRRRTLLLVLLSALPIVRPPIAPYA